jgi:hypothetical protein
LTTGAKTFNEYSDAASYLLKLVQIVFSAVCLTVVTELMLCYVLFVFYYSGNKYDGVWVTGVSSLSEIFRFIVTTRLTWRENPRQICQNTQLKKQFEQVSTNMKLHHYTH